MSGSQQSTSLQHEALAGFGELALCSDDLDHLLTEACRLVGEGLDVDLVGVMQARPDQATLLVRAGIGWDADMMGDAARKAVAGTLEGHALTSGQPTSCTGLEPAARLAYPSVLTGYGIEAVASVPILGGPNRPPFGVLQVGNRAPRQFSGGEILLLRNYANLIATTIGRLRARMEARDGEDRLRMALDAGEFGSWELDFATAAVTHTPRAMQIFGYPTPPPAWTYDVFLAHVLPEDRERVDSTYRNAVEAGSDWSFACRIRRASDGATRWIEVKGKSAADPVDGIPGYGVGIIADITARTLAEETLRHSNEALAAEIVERKRELVEADEKCEQVAGALRQSSKMEAVGQLTGGLAHDFNNMLAGISGNLELLRTRAAQGRTAELERYIEAALLSSQRAAALTHRLLAFSRRQTLDPQATDVNRLVGGMEELHRRTLGPSVQIEIRLAEGLWPTLCDPHQLENALLNLVINARDAMPDGGRLLVRTANTVPLGLSENQASPPAGPAGEYVTLTVTDTGIGMAPDVLARAFEPFFTTKPPGQGTGLGLSMIHGFVQQSGGQVHLRSEAGQGTTVTIYLPRHLGGFEAEREIAKVATLPIPSANSVVLLVEDEAAIRMIIAEVLVDLGFRVLQAGDGRSGLHILESATHIDLLVTDVGLPGGMDGRQLAAAARHGRPGLKVLFITGYGEGTIAHDSSLEFGTQVMTKPFGVAALAARVQGIISH